MNLVCIDGRLTKDTEVKMFDNSDKRVVSFSIACRRDEEHSDFINCIAWDSNADFINKYFKKGDGINITGELRQSNYKDKDGNNKYETHVLVRQAGFPIQKKKDETQSATQDGTQSGQLASSQIDDSKVQNTNFDKWEAGKDIKIDPDELPFY